MKELFNNIISVQFGASIAILLLLLSRRIMKKRYVAKLRYWLWLVIALRLCLPVDINIRLNRTAPVNVPVNDYYITAQLSQTEDRPTEFEIITADQLNLQPVPDTQSAAETPDAITTVSIADILYKIWLMVALLLAMMSAISYVLAKKDIMSTAVYSDDLATYTDRLKRQMGINRQVRTAVCNYTGSPMLIGLLDPVIVLPDVEYTPTQLEMIIRHELTHLRRNDILYKLLLHIVACVYWFNPLTACMARLAGKDIEISCDEDIVKTGDKQFRAEYAQTIIRVISMQNNKLILATNFSQNAKTVKERCSAIMLLNNLKKGRSIMFISFAVIAICATMTGCTVDRNNYTISNTVYYNVDNYKNYFGIYGETGNTIACEFTVADNDGKWNYDCQKLAGDIGDSLKIEPAKRYLYNSKETENIFDSALTIYGSNNENIFRNFSNDIALGNYLFEDSHLKWKTELDGSFVTVFLYKHDNMVCVEKIDISSGEYINSAA